MEYTTAIGPGTTARVQEYVMEHYVEPARRRGAATVRIRVGDVVRDLKLHTRTPLVCQALQTKKFLGEHSLELTGREGPPSGQGTRVALTYTILPQAEAGADAYDGLLGILGPGGEDGRHLRERAAWERGVREKFGGRA